MSELRPGSEIWIGCASLVGHQLDLRASLPRNAGHDLFKRKLRRVANICYLLQTNRVRRRIDAQKLVRVQLNSKVSKVVAQHITGEVVALASLSITLDLLEWIALA